MLGLLKYYRTESEADHALSQWDDHYFENDKDLIYIAVIKSRNWRYNFEIEFGRRSNNGILQNDKLPVQIPTYLPITNKNLPNNNSFSARKIRTRLVATNEVSSIEKDDSQDLAYDPIIQGGRSVSNLPRRLGGTLGCIFKMKDTEGYFGLSNCHVLQDNHPELGDDIYNPRVGNLSDNGQLNSAISGFLSWIKFTPYLDAAIYRIEDHKRIEPGLKNGDHLQGICLQPKRNLRVKKSGYKTNDKSGRIRSVNTSVRVAFDTINEFELFKRQIQTSKISASGDSGSVIYDRRNRVVGLLFADNKRPNIGYSYANNINYLFNKEFETTEYILHHRNKKKAIKKFELESFV